MACWEVDNTTGRRVLAAGLRLMPGKSRHQLVAGIRKALRDVKGITVRRAVEEEPRG